MHIIHYKTLSDGLEGRPNDEFLQKKWRKLSRIIPDASLPVNFADFGHIARSGLVFPQNLGTIVREGITDIVTLTESRQIYLTAQQLGLFPKELTVHHYPVNQRKFLTLQELANICSIIESIRRKSGKALVCCIRGATRTGGVMVAHEAILGGHEELEGITNLKGVTQLISRWHNFIRFGRKGIGFGDCFRDVYALQARQRFLAVEALSKKHGIPIPKYLYPQYLTINVRLMLEMLDYGRLVTIRPSLPPSEIIGDTIPSPTSHQHRQMVLPGRSLDIEMSSRGELLTT